MKAAAPELTLSYGDGRKHCEFTVRPVAAFDDMTLRRLLDAWRSKHRRISGMPDSIAGLGRQVFSFKGVQELSGFVSATEAAAHNAVIDGFYAEYERFLKMWPGAVNDQRRTLEFNLVLEKTGTAPADDVDVQLWTEASGIWLDEVPKLPTAPKVPRQRDLFGSAAVHIPDLSQLPANVFIRAGANENGPNIFAENSNQTVQYGIRRVKHHVPCQLPAVYFKFNSEADVGSFTVNAKLVAANIRKPRTDALHVQVSRSVAVAPPLPTEMDDEEEG